MVLEGFNGPGRIAGAHGENLGLDFQTLRVFCANSVDCASPSACLVGIVSDDVLVLLPTLRRTRVVAYNLLLTADGKGRTYFVSLTGRGALNACGPCARNIGTLRH